MASAAAQAKKTAQGSGTPGTGIKRAAGASSPTKRQKRTAAEASEEIEEEDKAGITPERAIDMKTLRRFRKGELVWFRVQTINPPSTSGSKDALPSITHWPGLIANIITRARSDGGSNGNVAGASLSAAWSIAGGKAPEALNKRTTYTFEHHIRPLGLFHPGSEVVETGDNILPWAMGKELLGGPKGWDLLGKEGTRIITEGIPKELEQDKENGVRLPMTEAEWDERWKAKWGAEIWIQGEAIGVGSGGVQAVDRHKDCSGTCLQLLLWCI